MEEQTPLAYTIKTEIRKAIKDIYDRDVDVKESDHLELDLGLDSLDRIEMLLSLEEHFLIDIPDDVAREFRTVENVIIYMEQKLGERNNE